MFLNKAFIIATSLGALFVVLLVVIVGPSRLLMMVGHLSLVDFLALVALSYVALFISALSFGNALHVYGCGIRLRSLANIKLIGYSVNYVAPSGIFGGFIGGDAVMALILNRKDGLEFKKGFSAGLSAKVIEFATFLLFVYAGLILGFRYFYMPPEIWFTLFIAAIFVGIVTLFFLINPIIDSRIFTRIIRYLSRFKYLDRVLKNISTHINEFERDLNLFYRKGKKYLFISLSLSIIETVILVFQVWLLVHYLGIDMGFSKTLLVYAVSTLVFALPLAPGSAGTYELSQVGLFALLGLGSDAGLTFSLVMRGVNLLLIAVSFFLVPRYGFHFFEKKKEEEKETDNNKKEYRK